MKPIIPLVFAALFVAFQSQAGTPVWTFTPLTSTTVSVPANGTAIVQYTVTNQSARTHVLAMQDITGVTQTTNGSGVCPSPFTLASHASCVLSLVVDGSQIQTGSTNGPVLCQQGGGLECYRPSASDVLTLDIADTQFSVGGVVSGLSGSVSLQNNGGDTIAINANGSFTFSTPIDLGSSYNVTVSTQPVCQVCTVTNGSGFIAGSNITNIQVQCATILVQGC